MKLITLCSKQDLEKVYPVVHELREHLNLDEFIKLYEQAHKMSNYQLVAFEDEQENIIAAMGYRILVDFVHGRHLYVDDLVTCAKFRSKGIGAKLLKIAEGIAAENNCNNLRLSTGIQNENGKKFYESNSWLLKAVVYKKKL